MAAATSLVDGSEGIFKFLLGEEGSYSNLWEGVDSSTSTSLTCTFLALGLDGCLFAAPFGLPLAFGLTGFVSSTGSGSISTISTGISNI